MIEAGLAALAALAAFVIYERHQERRQQQLIALVDRLCQRVQAPQAAVLEHDEQVRALRDEEYAPPAVPPDDDEAFWASRDKLAELMMEQELTDGR
jgi:hypothetical protein